MTYKFLCFEKNNWMQQVFVRIICKNYLGFHCKRCDTDHVNFFVQSDVLSSIAQAQDAPWITLKSWEHDHQILYNLMNSLSAAVIKAKRDSKITLNEWMMHLYSALLCIAVHPKRFTIMWGGGNSGIFNDHRESGPRFNISSEGRNYDSHSNFHLFTQIVKLIIHFATENCY